MTLEMEQKKSAKYLRAKKKVDTLKGFYGHLIAYLIVNTVLILVQAGLLRGTLDFSDWQMYVTAVMWGIGLLAHAMYVLAYFKVRNNFIRKWEERKMEELLNKKED